MRIQIHFIDSNILNQVDYVNTTTTTTTSSDSMCNSTSIIDTSIIDSNKNAIISNIFDYLSKLSSLKTFFKNNEHFRYKKFDCIPSLNKDNTITTINTLHSDTVRDFTSSTNITNNNNNDVDDDDDRNFGMIKNSCITCYYRHDIITDKNMKNMNNYIDLQLLFSFILLVKNILEIKDYINNDIVDYDDDTNQSDESKNHSTMIQSIRDYLDIDVLTIPELYNQLHDIEEILRAYKPILHITFFVEEFMNINHDQLKLDLFHLLHKLSICFELTSLSEDKIASFLQKNYIFRNSIYPTSNDTSIDSTTTTTTNSTTNIDSNNCNKGGSCDSNNNSNSDPVSNSTSIKSLSNSSTFSCKTVFLPLFENYISLLKESGF